MMQLINGKEVAAHLQSEIKAKVAERVAAGKPAPHLAAVLVGDDGASETYVNAKVKACDRIGFGSTLIRYDADVSEKELLLKIDELNKDESIDGFIVQLPLPKHILENKVIEAIDPSKDVDGFHPINLGRMVQGQPAMVSATPYGILKLIQHYEIPTEGKRCVVIGRSNIVGRPMSILLSRNSNPGNCTVTLVHSRTKDIPSIVKEADIIIAAIGKPGFVTAEMVKEGAVVIDVGTTRVTSKVTKSGFRLKGDVDFETVSQKCSYITPVPGGVGPMTITALLLNTLKAAEDRVLV